MKYVFLIACAWLCHKFALEKTNAMDYNESISKYTKHLVGSTTESLLFLLYRSGSAIHHLGGYKTMIR